MADTPEEFFAKMVGEGASGNQLNTTDTTQQFIDFQSNIIKECFIPHMSQVAQMVTMAPNWDFCRGTRYNVPKAIGGICISDLVPNKWVDATYYGGPTMRVMGPHRAHEFVIKLSRAQLNCWQSVGWTDAIAADFKLTGRNFLEWLYRTIYSTMAKNAGYFGNHLGIAKDVNLGAQLSAPKLDHDKVLPYLAGVRSLFTRQSACAKQINVLAPEEITRVFASTPDMLAAYLTGEGCECGAAGQKMQNNFIDLSLLGLRLHYLGCLTPSKCGSDYVYPFLFGYGDMGTLVALNIKSDPWVTPDNKSLVIPIEIKMAIEVYDCRMLALGYAALDYETVEPTITCNAVG